ncbi:MAG: beta strand repeat-containing protein, partial [Isosphaeraceae bacterium]
MSRRYPWLRSGNIGRPSRASRYRPAVLELESRRLLSNYIVNDPGDLALDPAMGPGLTENGTVSLRSAIQQVNIDGSGSIDFASKMTIRTSGLPVITADGVTIDGGMLGLVEISGDGGGASGLVLAGADDVITALMIVGFGGDGIDVGAPGATIGGTAGGSGNIVIENSHLGIALGSYGGDALVAGNYVGTDGWGTPYLGNGSSGIYIGSAGNTIGSTVAGAGNVISGNAANGIDIAGTAATGNVVEGDYIGTNTDGVAALGNYNGVFIEGGASDNLIGTNGDGVNDAAERNIISGNRFEGVDISGSGTDGNVIAGNYIGLDGTGTSAVGNGGAGVVLQLGARDNTIGGLTAAMRNVIGGNGDRGVLIGTPAFSTTPTTGNVIEGNYIGTDASGMSPMGNHRDDAVSINRSPGNTIGGTVAGAGNVLDGGGDSGVFVYGDYQLGTYASAAGTLIAGNIIGLAADGVTGGPGFGNTNNGVTVDSAPDTTIGGTVAASRNIISNNGRAGVMIANFEEPDGAYGTVVQGNFIGTDITGTLARGNAIGVDIEGASSSLIGTDGTGGVILDAAEGNLISGNRAGGVLINGAAETFNDGVSLPGAADNTIAGNLIGTTAGGTAGLA